MTMFGSQWFAAPDTTYEIDQSIRFNDGDSAHLSRTLGTASNRKIWTYSLWMKRATLGTRQMFFTVAAGGGAQGIIEFDQGDGGDGGMDKLVVNNETSGTTALNWELEIAFRDPAAWYNFVFVYDSTQSTTNDRFKCYVNGTLQTAWDRNSTPGQNEEQAFNNALDHRIGEGHTAANYFDGYMAEIHFIDGTAKAASDFGETSSDTGQWVPKAYSGSYGNNGFYLKGQDSSALGDDTSGNGNDFASSGLAAADQVSDSPTSNHCTLNPLNKDTDCTLSDGNLQVGWTSGTDPIICGTMAVSSGKWYYEATFTGTFNFPGVGIAPAELSFGGSAFSSGTGTVFYYAPSGNYRGNGDNVSYGAEYFVTSKIGVALNLDDNEITFYKDNSSQGTLNLASIRSGYSTWVPLLTGGGSTENIIVNFGQSDFEYTPPTGFKAWSVANMNDPTIEDPKRYFGTLLYTGNGTTGQTVTGLSTSSGTTWTPDWVWIKPRSAAYNSKLFDSVRTLGFSLESSTTNAQADLTGEFIGFADGGFQVDDNGSNNINQSGITHVGWCWEANGSGGSNGDGSITSTVSASATSGFSIIKWTGTAANGTIGHGLGVQPSLFIIKNTATTNSWLVGSTLYAATAYLSINNTDALATGDAAVFNSTHPTSSVINLGSNVGANGSSGTNNMICYAFANVEGFCKIDSYTGNGNAEGPFVHTGFSPQWILFRVTSTSDAWQIYDTKRHTINPFGTTIAPNSNAVESSFSARLDILSNGFKVRTTNTALNGSGEDYIFMAFAESPFKTANAQ